MKYSNLLGTRVITERQGAKMPRLVYYAKEDEILNKKTFLDWDILSATSTRALFDYAIALKMSAFIEQSLGDSTDKTISLAVLTDLLNQLNTKVSTTNTNLSNEITRSTNVEADLKQEIADVSLKLSSKTELIEQEDYEALTSYDADIIYFVYKPLVYTLTDKPISQTFTYDGTVHTLSSTDAYTVTGDGGSEVGVYTFTVSLNKDYASNTAYKWSDGTLTDIIVTYTIKAVSTAWSFGNSFPIKFS